MAVVDLLQLLGSNSEWPNDPGVRLRLQTPAIPLAAHQRAAKQELMDAVAAELLVQAKGTDTGEQHKPEEQATGRETPDVMAA
ncbi:hypothetical protein BL107_07509 [Synechococcus sp. BL107]|nr:hypothetical protein BL107_07509 [Synechococcus sp. BL107]